MSKYAVVYQKLNVFFSLATRQKELSDKDFISSWETQRVLILDVFSNRQASMNINYIQAAQV
jgi:hypothetical protein